MALVIIGTGLAGYNLAREWRKLNPTDELVIITRDDGRNYSKPMLSTGYTKGKTADQLAMQTAAQMAEQLKADIRTFASVSAIDATAKTITVDGAVLAYDKWRNSSKLISAPLPLSARLMPQPKPSLLMVRC